MDKKDVLYGLPGAAPVIAEYRFAGMPPVQRDPDEYPSSSSSHSSS